MRSVKTSSMSITCRILMITLITISFAGCEKSTIDPKEDNSNSLLKSTSTPVIDYVIATPEQVNPGEKTMISWKVANADYIELKGWDKLPERIFEMEDSLAAYPETSTNYTITAYNSDGEVASKSILVTVNTDPTSTPVFEYLTVTPPAVVVGDTVVISWKVANADYITLQIGEKILDAIYSTEYSYWVCPQTADTTEYIVHAHKGDISISESILVTSINPAPVVSFTASSTVVSRGTMVELEWYTENVKEAYIQIGTIIRNIEPNTHDSLTLTPNQTRTYVLHCVGNDGSVVEKSITIEVI